MEEKQRSDNFLYKLTLGRPVLWFPIICFAVLIGFNTILGHLSDFQLSQVLIALIVVILFPVTWLYFVRYDSSARGANRLAGVSALVFLLALTASTIMENSAVVPLLKMEKDFISPEGWTKIKPRGEISYPTSEIKTYGKGILGCFSKSPFQETDVVCPKVESTWENGSGYQLTVDDLQTIAATNGYSGLIVSDKCGKPEDQMEVCSLTGVVDGATVSLSYYSYGGITQDFTLTFTSQ